MRKKTKVLIIIAIVVILVILIWLRIIPILPAGPGATDLSSQIIAVTKSDVTDVVLADGRITAERSDSVYSPVNGVLKEIRVNPGDQVGEDVVLAILETADARGRNSTTEIKSLVAGTVTNILTNLGMPVRVGQTEVARIASLGKIKAVTTVGENDATRLAKDQKVTATITALDDIEVTGQVAAVAWAAADSQADVPQYAVVINLDHVPDKVRPDMTASLRIIVNEKKGVLVVNDIYIYEKDNKSWVKKLTFDDKENPQVSETPVTIGLHGENTVEITAGLTENDQLVLPTAEITQINSRFQRRGFMGGGN